MYDRLRLDLFPINGTGHVFGEDAALNSEFGATWSLGVTYESCSQCELWSIQTRDLFEVLKDFPDARRGLVTYLVEEAQMKQCLRIKALNEHIAKAEASSNTNNAILSSSAWKPLGTVGPNYARGYAALRIQIGLMQLAIRHLDVDMLHDGMLDEDELKVMAPGMYGVESEYEQQAREENTRAIEDSHADRLKSLRVLAGVDHVPSTKFQRFLQDAVSTKQLKGHPHLKRTPTTFVEPRSLHAAGQRFRSSKALESQRSQTLPDMSSVILESSQSEKTQPGKEHRAREESSTVSRTQIAELMSSVRRIATELATIVKETKQNTAAVEALREQFSSGNNNEGRSPSLSEVSIPRPRAGGVVADRSLGDARAGVSPVALSRSPRDSREGSLHGT